MEQTPDIGLIRLLARITHRLHSVDSLDDTLQAVTDGVVDGLGFRAALLSIVGPDDRGDLTAVSASGLSPGEHEEIIGQIGARASYDRALRNSEVWGELRFSRRVDIDDLPSVTPAGSDPPDDEHWHANDSLFAPIHGLQGELVAVLSVDMLPGAPLPEQATRELLQIFADNAGAAITRTRLLDDLRRERQELRLAGEAFNLAFAYSAGPMATVSLAPENLGRFEVVNAAFAATLGIPSEEVSRMTLDQALGAANATDSLSLLSDLDLDSTATSRREMQYIREDGSTAWLMVVASGIRMGGGRGTFALVHMEDLTQRKIHEMDLERQVMTDPLTGLGNRRELTARMLESTSGMLLFIDLDRFKRVNDTFGHASGDSVLIAVAREIETHVRDIDLVARIGGDEFVVLAEGMTQEEGLSMSERIRQAVSDLRVEGVDQQVTVSIGLVPLDADTDITERLNAADEAMYRDKQRTAP